MKRNIIRNGIAVAGLMLCLIVGAHAADFTVQADRLSALGLFQGTDSGYDLDRTPTRAEAATMLVRLMGQEEAAQRLEAALPFTDLVGWETPYVAYLYENGLTTGTSDTTFSPNAPCDMQMYSAFLLRALGYSEQSGDFAYADALQLAGEKGIYEQGIFGTDVFLRNDMVAMSYSALATDMKSRDGVMLLEALMESGAVSYEAGAQTKEWFATYRNYRDAFSAMPTTTQFSVQGTAEGKLYNSSGTVTIETQSTASFAWDLRAETMYASETLTISAPDVDDVQIVSERYQNGSNLSVTRNGAKFTMDDVRNGYGYRIVPLVFAQAITQTDTGYEIDCNIAYLPYCMDVFGAGVDAISITDETLTVLTITQKEEGGLLSAQSAEASSSMMSPTAAILKSDLVLDTNTED